ncbi:MAG TPA: sigma-70 family RNA polymerase sigma factor, partial [Chitinophagaceae bacterium]|nr:sigma-70 family RNA polymerase sigma factor [Chitinophagaceae bacterium]
IFQIAKNKWIDHLRSRKNKQTVSLEDSMVNGTTTDMISAENAEYLDTVKNEMKSLGERCRELLNRFYYHKQSIREIAQHFNWTEPSAKNNKYRCLQELRTLVKNKVQK